MRKLCKHLKVGDRTIAKHRDAGTLEEWTRETHGEAWRFNGTDYERAIDHSPTV